MPDQETLNDRAWQILFDARPSILHDVNTTGIHRITATEINQISGREARLMTKFDHTANLPRLFEQHDLAILPASRGTYVIGRFKCYQDIGQDADEEIIGKPFPDQLQSIDPSDLYNEPAALLCAYHAGLIEDVLEEEVALTVYGRMGTDDFNFVIQTEINGTLAPHPIRVDRSQCEVDGGFEGPESFAIVEVKGIQIDDFHIRQLYYPYRLWLAKEKMNKRIVPVFLTYSNEVFTFSVYDFADANNFNSLELVKRKRYQIVQTEIEVSDIRQRLERIQAEPEPPGVPFPQADKFERVIDMLGRLRVSNGTITQEETTSNYAFDLRQTQYYTNAGRYLGLIERGRDTTRGVYYTLTARGLQLMNNEPRRRNLALIELILSRRVFRTAVEFALDNYRLPSVHEAEGFIQQAGISLSGTTPHRRAQSVIGWVRWMIGLTADA